jgi:LacI family transcriptional regulator
MNEQSHSSDVTLRDIGKCLGISHVTVSLALRNDPQIPPARRREVQEKAVEMGYRPNPMATALGQMRFANKARAITAELAWIDYRGGAQDIRRFKEFELYWKGASQTAHWFGYNLEEYVCNANLTLARLKKILFARGVRGILLPPRGLLPPEWDDFPWERFSAVRFGHSILKPRFHVVTSDQTSNGLQAFARMRDLGYDRVGYASSSSISTRHQGGVLMAQSHLKPTERISPLIFATGENNTVNRKQLGQWIKKTNPDAILTDVAAVREMLQMSGWRVPEDIGMAVFSVLDGNADSGIYQNPEEIGKAAVEMLISLVNHNHTGIPKICRELLIEGEWVNGTTLPRRLPA